MRQDLHTLFNGVVVKDDDDDDDGRSDQDLIKQYVKRAYITHEVKKEILIHKQIEIDSMITLDFVCTTTLLKIQSPATTTYVPGSTSGGATCMQEDAKSEKSEKMKQDGSSISVNRIRFICFYICWWTLAAQRSQCIPP